MISAIWFIGQRVSDAPTAYRADFYGKKVHSLTILGFNILSSSQLALQPF